MQIYIKGLSRFIELFKDEVNKPYLVTISGESLKLDSRIQALPFGEFNKELERV